MHPELPVCRRCCFCLPLRYGLIAWGYLKLAFSCLLVIYLIVLMNWFLSQYHPMSTGAEWTEFLQIVVAPSIAICITFIDVILNIAFIVGCHKKNVRLIKIYYVYSIVVLVLVTIISIYITCSSIYYAFGYTYLIGNIIMEAMPLLAYIGLEAYLLLLIRSELIKLNNGCQFRFMNNAADAECTLTVEDNQLEEKNTNK